MLCTSHLLCILNNCSGMACIIAKDYHKNHLNIHIFVILSIYLITSHMQCISQGHFNNMNKIMNIIHRYLFLHHNNFACNYRMILQVFFFNLSSTMCIDYCCFSMYNRWRNIICKSNYSNRHNICLHIYKY